MFVFFLCLSITSDNNTRIVVGPVRDSIKFHNLFSLLLSRVSSEF